jgi:hypothetical protein
VLISAKGVSGCAGEAALMSTPLLLTYGFGVIVEPATAIKRTVPEKIEPTTKIRFTQRLVSSAFRYRSSPLLTITFPSLKEMKLEGKNRGALSIRV